MWEAVFGTDLPLPVKFIVAFVLVLALIVGTAYLVRRFGAGALNAVGAARGRQPRLALIESTQIDPRRSLLLIRRDNVEHLVMVGGPTDVVIEPNIVRAAAAAASREAQPARVTPAVADTLPRAVPLAEAAWPAEPELEPAPRPTRTPSAPASPPVEKEASWPAPPQPASRAAPETPARTQSPDRLAGLAADLSRNLPGEPEAPAAPRRSAEIRRPPPTPVQPLAESEEQNLAEMAHRLESALNRPRPPSEPAVEPAARVSGGDTTASPAAEPRPATEPRLGPEPRPLRVEPRPARVEQRPVRPEPKPASKPAFDSLEQEMASLLGRPSGKT